MTGKFGMQREVGKAEAGEVRWLLDQEGPGRHQPLSDG